MRNYVYALSVHLVGTVVTKTQVSADPMIQVSIRVRPVIRWALVRIPCRVLPVAAVNRCHKTVAPGVTLKSVTYYQDKTPEA